MLIENQINRAVFWNTPNSCPWDPLTIFKIQILEENEKQCPWETTNILTSYLLEKREQTFNCIYYFSKQSGDILIWLCKRFPNLSEVVTNVPFTAIIDMSLEIYFEEWFSQFSENPSEKAFLRDTQKLVSNIFAWQSGAKQGGTEIKYDIGNVYSQTVKAVCKLSIIKGGEIIYGPKVLKGVGGWANVFCEPPARIFSLLSQLKQKENATEIEYFQYAKKNITPYLLLQAFTEASAKNWASFKADALIKRYGIAKVITKFLDQTQAKVISQLTGLTLDFSPKEISTIASKLQAIADIQDGSISMPNKAQLYLTEFVGKALSATGFTYVLVTVTKIAQDGAGNILNTLKNIAIEIVELGNEAYESAATIMKDYNFYSAQPEFNSSSSEGLEENTCPAPQIYGYEESDYTNFTFTYLNFQASDDFYEMPVASLTRVMDHATGNMM